MRIVYDKMQAWEKALAGWPDPMPGSVNDSKLGPDELDLWNHLAPGQTPHWRQAALADDSLGFWDQLYLVGEAAQSQYDVLRSCPLKPNHRLACVALSGFGFHGQRRRPWLAREGNLHLSISVPLDLASGSQALAWTMLPAVALMRALKCLGMPESEPCGIKWVNDVLWGRQKLGGVISSLTICDNRIVRGFLGIGLNVAKVPDLPVETCCLHQHMNSDHAPLGRVLQVVLASVADLITLLETGRDEAIFQEYRHNCLVMGQMVRIMTDPEVGSPVELCRGKVLGINPDLGLMIEGQESPVRHGRLHFL